MNFSNLPFFSILVTFSALVQAALGFGFTPITMAFFPNMMDYSSSVAISITVIFLSTLILSIKYRKYTQWKILLPIMIPTMGMNILFALISANISSQTMYIFLGFMLVAIAVFFFVFSERIRIRPTPAAGVVMGCICGVGYGLFAIGGPTAALFLMPAVEDKNEYMGTMQMFLCWNNGLGVLIRILTGAISLSIMPTIGIGWGFMLLGTVIGLFLFKRIPKELFRKIIYAFVGVNGAWIIISHFI